MTIGPPLRLERVLGRGCAEFAAHSGELREIPAAVALWRRARRRPADGLYGRVGRHLVVLAGPPECACVWVDGRRHPADGMRATVVVEDETDRAVLVLTRAGAEVERLTYRLRVPWIARIDPTFDEGPEEHDVGFWLAHVLEDPARIAFQLGVVAGRDPDELDPGDDVD